MFFSAIADEASERAKERVGRPRYTAFRGYPIREWLEFLPAAAIAAFPRHPAREGMRRFGHGAFRVFRSSMAGRVLFSMAGHNIQMAMAISVRAFDVIGSHGSVELLVNDPGRAVFGLRNMWDFVDAWHVGVYEGAMEAFGLDGRVQVCLHDVANADLELTFEPR